jgi:VWFA-related protein
MRRLAAGLGFGVLVVAGPLAARNVAPGVVTPAEERPAATFEEAVDVSLLTLVVRAVDTWGNPILGLQPADFRVRVGRKRVPIVAVEWVTGGEETPPAAPVDAGTTASPAGGDEGPAPAAAASTGRLVVVFVQADFHTSRISGQMRLRPYTRELLETFGPGDRVAVVSFDSHLKLWQDFDDDLEATHEAIDVAMRFSREVAVTPAEPHSMARHFDYAAAYLAGSPERALELVGRALEPLPGEKTVIFLGWGIGRYDAGGVHMTPAYAPAVRALHAARASVFVLDVTSADSHSLSVGLEGVAAATGGLYFATFRLPGQATRMLGRAISGYYVLTLDRTALTAAKEGTLRVDLERNIGTVLTRSTSLR